MPSPRKQPVESRHGPAYPAPVERLLTELTRLPGIGRRSAERIAFQLLRGDAESANRLAKAVTDVKSAIGHCAVYTNLTESSPCPVCASEKRDRSLVLVVEQPRDQIAIEQTAMYRGLYHVLLGRISPLDGTALYLMQELQSRPVRVTRLARGLPSGWSMELASKAVLADAIEGRQKIKE